MTITRIRGFAAAATIIATGLCATSAFAFGEAGPLNIKSMGSFFVGAEVSAPAADGSVTVQNQSYVGFALPVDKKYESPVLLVHGGGGQSADWFSTVDGRDGWRSYLLAAGLDTYWIDRPGYGRSPASPSYGPDGAKGQVGQGTSELITRLTTSKHWPNAPKHDGELDRDLYLKENMTNPSVIGWLQTSPGGPYGGNELSRVNILKALDETGPAILFSHSAGVAPTVAAALSAPAGAVKGMLVFEGGVDLLNDTNRGLGQWEPALAADFAPVDVGGCMMQPEGNVSKNVALANVPFIIVRSDYGTGSDAGFVCAVKQLEQAGVTAKFVTFSNAGIHGNGHFAMSETNSADVVKNLIIPALAELEGGAALPAEWSVSVK